MENQTPLEDNPLSSLGINWEYVKQIAPKECDIQFLVEIMDLVVKHCSISTEKTEFVELCRAWLLNPKSYLAHPEDTGTTRDVLILIVFLLEIRVNILRAEEQKDETKTGPKFE